MEQDMEDEFEDDEEDEEEIDHDGEMRRLQRMVGLETGEIEGAGDGEEEGEEDGDEDEFEDALLGEELLAGSQAIGAQGKRKKAIDEVQKVRVTKAESTAAILVHKANLMCLLVRGMQNRYNVSFA